MPCISIIIPTLNEEKFLPHLLQNLIEQTTSDFEVIHVDGQSTDNTVKIAAKLGEKLANFKQIITPTRHVSHQRNLGTKTATGEFLLFIDADTQLPPYFIEGLSYQLHRHPSDMFTTWSIPDSQKAGDKALVTIVNLSMEVAKLVDSPAAIGVLMGCTQKAFQKIGGFDEKVHFGEDEDFIKTGYKKHLSFKIYKEPRFIYSLRRFRKEGTLPSLQQLAAKKLKIIKAREYPMGGHNFTDDHLKSPLFTQIDNFLKTLSDKKIPLTRQTKIKTFLHNLLTFEEISQD